MAESIETFVAKLKAEGVDAGRAEAEALKSQAEAEAAGIIKKAKDEADAIVAKAKSEGEQIAVQAREDLRIAARDAVLELRQSLSQILTGVLQGEVKSALGDADFVKNALQELVREHAKSELTGDLKARIAVDQKLAKPLAEWAMRALNNGGKSVDVQGSLKSAGFEYRTADGILEVTEESVTDLLKEIVAPAIRDILDAASKNAAVKGA